MNKYIYNGPVMEFEKCIANHWEASTYAVSEKKARSNLIFRFKQETNKMPYAKIALPGKITMIDGKENVV